jgi:hypothetical protein
MLLAFFDSKGRIFTHVIHSSASLDANYIIKVLGRCPGMDHPSQCPDALTPTQFALANFF